MQLTQCQAKALEKLQSNKNIFLTGKAGAGKSFLLSHFRETYLETTGKNIPVVAATGVAAVAVKGQTLHSFFKLGMFDGSRENYVKTLSKALSNQSLCEYLRELEIIIIDEISMIAGYTLACTEEICRKSRFSKEPWGGIKVIVVGDFAQLPPISNYTSSTDWAFAHPVWEYSNFTPTILKTMVRTEDPKLENILNKVREGKTTKEIRKMLNNRIIPASKINDSNTPGTRVFPRNKQVDSYNQIKFRELTTPSVVFSAKFSGVDWAQDKLEQSAPVPAILRLRVGAVVMLRVNNPWKNYHNGSVGIVMDVSKERLIIELDRGKQIIEVNTYVFEYSHNNKVVATMQQFPVCLGWSMSGHKVQGATLDKAVVDLSNLWDSGQFYTMLSRVRRLDDLYLCGWDLGSIRVSKKVRQFHNSIGFVDDRD